MMAIWRIGLALLATLGFYLLSKPVVEVLLNTIRSRVDKRVRWIADVQHYMLDYIWWLMFLLLVRDVVANYILDLGDHKGEVMEYLEYLVAIPLVLGTFALRKVATNLFIRHFKWDRESSDYDARIFVVTESIKFFCVALILVEIFYIFFLSSTIVRVLLAILFLSIELIVILAGFTVLKNVATGLFLIFAEPFRTGTECRVRSLVGLIERVSLARTIMRRADGSRVFVPNGIFADNHQTSGNPLDVHTHTLMLQLHPATCAQRTQDLVDQLLVVLVQYAMPPEALAALNRGQSNGSGISMPSHADSSATDTPNNADSALGSTRRRWSVMSTTGPATAGLSISTRRGTTSFSNTTVGAYGGVLPAPRPPVRVELHAMYQVKVSVLVDRERFQSLEKAKTEVNLAIVDTLQRLHVVAQQTGRSEASKRSSRAQ